MSNECVINTNKPNMNELISFVNTEQYDKLEDAWLGIIDSNSKNLQALFEIVDILAKREDKKRAHDFLITLAPHYKQRGHYQDVLEILKKVLEYNPKEKGLAKEIAECYSYIYKDRPYAKDLIEKTCIETTSDIRCAITKLEKYFYLDCGDYVYHKSWGVGQVFSVDAQGEKVNINFEKKSNHSVAMDIAPAILQKLDKDDLLAMIYAQKDVLNKMIEENPVDLIKLTLKYFKGRASVSHIKNRLISGVIPPEAWSRWWTSTKKLLKKDPYIKLTDGTPTTSFLEFRASPMSHHHEILEKLSQTKDISKKIAITKSYISEMKNTEISKETLCEIVALFKNESDQLYGTNPSLVTECLLLLDEIQGVLMEEPGKYIPGIETLISTHKILPELVENMDILEYKKHVLGLIKKIKSESWQKEFVSCFLPTAATCGNLSLGNLLLKTSVMPPKR